MSFFFCRFSGAGRTGLFLVLPLFLACCVDASHPPVAAAPASQVPTSASQAVPSAPQTPGPPPAQAVPPIAVAVPAVSSTPGTGSADSDASSKPLLFNDP